MKVLRFAAVAALLATPALAAPPPLPVAVTFMKQDGAAITIDQSYALLRGLVADNWFGEEPEHALLGPIATSCPLGPDTESCARSIAAQRRGSRPVEVLVLLAPGADGRTRWTCVGSAPPATDPSAELDLGSPSAADRTHAAQCIIAAAAH